MSVITIGNVREEYSWQSPEREDRKARGCARQHLRPEPRWGRWDPGSLWCLRTWGHKYSWLPKYHLFQLLAKQLCNGGISEISFYIDRSQFLFYSHSGKEYHSQAGSTTCSKLVFKVQACTVSHVLLIHFHLPEIICLQYWPLRRASESKDAKQAFVGNYKASCLFSLLQE